MKVAVNGCELNVQVNGQGPPVIALHGAPGLGSHATPQRAFHPLTDTHALITYDARGSGHSQVIPPFTHEQWVADLDALREHFGFERFILTGGSYGGFISLEYVLRHPERVSHLVLRDTAARSYSEHAKANALARAKEFPAITEAVLERIFAGTVRNNDDYKRCFEAIAPLYEKHYDPEAVKKKIDNITFHFETKNYAFAHNLPNYDLRSQLAKVETPTLIIVGRHDWITPVEASEELASLMPNAELVVFEDSGHSPQLEENERFIATIRDFLARHNP